MFRKSIGLLAASAALGLNHTLASQTAMEITPDSEDKPPRKPKFRYFSRNHQRADKSMQAIWKERLDTKNRRRAENGLPPLTSYSQV